MKLDCNLDYQSYSYLKFILRTVKLQKFHPDSLGASQFEPLDSKKLMFMIWAYLVYET